MRKIETKKAAIELSIGTIVIVVLAMTMLILGIVLVRSIFTGAKYNVDQMNDKVRDEINKLFTEDKKLVVYLPNRKAEIEQGDEFGVAFAVQNTGQTQRFSWDIRSDDEQIRTKCGITELQAEAWISTGKSGSVEIASGDKYHELVRFNIPEAEINDVSTCIVRFYIDVKREDKEGYATQSFDVDVQ
jgi:hypothetical protein